MKRLKGKVAVVTGAVSGIGRATARALGEQGCSVLIHGPTQDDAGTVAELTGRGFDVAYAGQDLTDPVPGARHIVDAATSRWGRIDILVSNAAAMLHRPLDAVTGAQWDTVMAVNVKAPFFLVQAARRELTRTQGCVILVSSTNALGVQRNNLVYDTSKAALNHLAMGLALELRDDGVRVNALMPGGTRSPLLERWQEEASGSREGARQMMEAGERRGSIAEPEWIADAAVALASGEMNWVNGAVIPVDGGFRLGR
ncbi:SDR family NAD(P)-dependent oxidoreductase [Streptomyces sp. NPDC059720]|uniref:SDR family NAD(P)-dependent oxidoreductase n=1 Tax=Streptomyces sp. NPDC059720 TaxID=3346924 RepID=UPI0036A00FE3